MHDPKLAWFCLRSQVKHEHIAAAHLRRRSNLEVFVPRIRFKRTTRIGSSWVTEALFPNYLFARFDWHSSLREVYHSPGVSEVVHFGSHWPIIPDDAIETLRASLGKNEIHVIPAEVSPGDVVRIAGSSFHGLQAVVSRIMPSASRVAVLLDFLGSQTAVELDIGNVVRDENERSLLIQKNQPKPPK